MKIRVTLSLKDQKKAEEWIEIDDRKLEELTEDELENAIDIVVRDWANEAIRIEWETEEGEPED